MFRGIVNAQLARLVLFRRQVNLAETNTFLRR